MDVQSAKRSVQQLADFSDSSYEHPHKIRLVSEGPSVLHEKK